VLRVLFPVRLRVETFLSPHAARSWDVMPLYTNGVGVGYVAAASVDCSEFAGMGLVEKGAVIGEIRGFLGWRRREQQIPRGNDRKKSKGKGNDRLALVVSHPSDRDKYVARMGHPRLFLSPGKRTARAEGDGLLVSVGKEIYTCQP